MQIKVIFIRMVSHLDSGRELGSGLFSVVVITLAHRKGQRKEKKPIEARSKYFSYLLVSTRTVIGQFSGPYSPVRPAKI